MVSAAGRRCALVFLSLLFIPCTDCFCVSGDVRLTGGLADYEGNVQVCINGEWGYVCHGYWDSIDAQVVCRQLEYSTIGAIYKYGSHYGYGNGTLWMNYVHCTGSEMKLLDCPNSYGISYFSAPLNCNYERIAGVICPSGGSNCTNGDIRLVSSTKYGRSEGRVEVCSNNEWGTVCSNGWDSNDATVACKQLGYTGYIEYYASSSYYGNGSGSIWLTDLACNSSDTSLFDCPHSTNTSNCTHSNNVGVICYAIDDTSCTSNSNVKIWSAYESTPDNEGIPLVCSSSGNWYPFYDTATTCFSLILACKAVGYSGIEYYRSDGGKQYGYYYNNHYRFRCYSSISYNTLWDCSYKYGYTWDHSMGVKCHKNITASHCSVEGSVRLVDGETANEGRIEYCYNNEWAPICSNRYMEDAADLICKELGYNSVGSQVFSDNKFNQSAAKSSFKIDYLLCSSSHTSLSQCKPYIICGVYECQIQYGLRCYELSSDPECTNGDVRLADGLVEQEGRPEVCVNGLWSQICDNGWSNNDVYTICRGLGYVADSKELGPTAIVNSGFGSGYGPVIWSSVDCDLWHKDIFDCVKTVYPDFYCDNLNIAGVQCTEGCSDGEIRLVGGASIYEGTVEVCYNELWGLISDDGWSDNDAIVVCRQLGYNTENTDDFQSVVGSYYGKPNKTIHLKDASCSSLETSILSCTVQQLSLSDGKALLPITDVAGVKCQSTSPPICVSNIDTSVSCTTSGSVRLIRNGEDSNEVGMVEYCNGTYWTPLCSIDNKVATVICRQLGHTSYSWGSLLWYRGNQATTSLVQNITCNGDEDTVTNCTIIQPYNGCMDCSRHTLVGLRCYDTNTLCDDGSVRLVNGLSDNEGRVELCVNGLWGSVCDSDWDTTDGLIVCQQLGYTKQEPTVFYNSHYGDGSFPVVYSNVDCKGWEDSISDCVKDDYLSYTCYPGHTAGLRCNGSSATASKSQSNIDTAGIVGGSLGAVIVLVTVVFLLILLMMSILKRSSVQEEYQLEADSNPIYEHMNISPSPASAGSTAKSENESESSNVRPPMQ